MMPMEMEMMKGMNLTPFQLEKVAENLKRSVLREDGGGGVGGVVVGRWWLS